MHFTQAFQAFKGTLGMGAVILRGGFPEGKGLVERVNRYLEPMFWGSAWGTHVFKDTDGLVSFSST